MMKQFEILTETNGFTVINNTYLQDKELSLAAWGLMTKLFSLPNDWDYTEFGLTKICNAGRDAIRSALKELEFYGYLLRERTRDSRGKLQGTKYTISATRKFNNSPMSDFPTLGKPTLDNPTLESNKVLNKLNTKLTNKRESNNVHAHNPLKLDDIHLISISQNLKNFNEERFFYYYESKNWLIGNTPITRSNLKSVILAWYSKEDEFKNIQPIIHNHNTYVDGKKQKEITIEEFMSSSSKIKYDPILAEVDAYFAAHPDEIEGAK